MNGTSVQVYGLSVAPDRVYVEVLFTRYST